MDFMPGKKTALAALALFAGAVYQAYLKNWEEAWVLLSQALAVFGIGKKIERNKEVPNAAVPASPPAPSA